MKFSVANCEINYEGDKSTVTIHDIENNIETLEALMRVIETANCHKQSTFAVDGSDCIIKIPEMTADACNIIYSSILQIENIIFQLKHVSVEGYNFYRRINMLKQKLL